MRVRALGGDAAARSPRQETLLQQVGLVDFLDRVGFFAPCRGKALDADRAAVELVDYRAENRTIHLVEGGRGDFEQLERAQRNLARDDRRFVDLREVADAAQQAIDYSRSAARPRRELMRTALVDCHIQQRGRAADNLAELLVIVKIEMEMLAEAVAQRRAKQARAGGRAHQRERIDRQLHRARAHPLTHHDMKLEILHRRVKPLLDDALQAMNLVDEQHVVLFEVVDDRGQVGGALDRRARSDVNVDAELARDDMRERGLAEAGGPREQHVIEHFAASARGGNRHAENFLVALLADEFVERAVVVVNDSRRQRFLGGWRSAVGVLLKLTFRQAAPPVTCEL